MTQPTLNQEIIQPVLETIYVGPVFFLSSIAALILFRQYFYVEGKGSLWAYGSALVWMAYFLMGISYFFFSFKG